MQTLRFTFYVSFEKVRKMMMSEDILKIVLSHLIKYVLSRPRADPNVVLKFLRIQTRHLTDLFCFHLSFSDKICSNLCYNSSLVWILWLKFRVFLVQSPSHRRYNFVISICNVFTVISLCFGDFAEALYHWCRSLKHQNFIADVNHDIVCNEHLLSLGTFMIHMVIGYFNLKLMILQFFHPILFLSCNSFLDFDL